MRFPKVFSKEYWVDPLVYVDETHYQHEPRVLPFPSAHARNNAAYAAQLLEDDRVAVRRQELRVDLMRQLRLNREEHARIQGALDELDALDTLERRT